MVLPKHALSSGVVRIERNDSHGITPGSPLAFHSLLDVGAVIQKVLIQHGVVLHSSRTTKKYLAPANSRESVGRECFSSPECRGLPFTRKGVGILL